ncbi:MULTISPECIES: hypothetical protein [unclassified Pantoea]|uniref:hypothetical protein n=1 Tax=unclassified Pantoea TaxID=2630326 RepID=UPI00211814FD|nr:MULTISPECIES: hypothetical protein [unclassified Pantoea]
MKDGFEDHAYDAACMIMGKAVWQLVASGELVTQEAVATKIVELSKRRADLAASIALSVLLQS